MLWLATLFFYLLEHKCSDLKVLNNFNIWVPGGPALLFYPSFMLVFIYVYNIFEYLVLYSGHYTYKIIYRINQGLSCNIVFLQTVFTLASISHLGPLAYTDNWVLELQIHLTCYREWNYLQLNCSLFEDKVHFYYTSVVLDSNTCPVEFQSCHKYWSTSQILSSSLLNYKMLLRKKMDPNTGFPFSYFPLILWYWLSDIFRQYLLLLIVTSRCLQ